MRYFSFIFRLFVLLLVVSSCSAKADDPLKNAVRKVESKYADGKDSLVVYYSDDSKHEKIKEEVYHDNGELAIEGMYKNNKRNGLWRAWFPNGNIQAESEYTEEVPNGIRKVYFENGRLMYSGMMKDGKKTGSWTFYDANGNVIKEEKY